MIDTDKYEGHTLNDLEVDADLPTWGVYDKEGNVVADYNPTDDDRVNEANARLIADAPLLLEEVKRLREIESEWKQMWSKLEDYPDICAELICFMESEEE